MPTRQKFLIFLIIAANVVTILLAGIYAYADTGQYKASEDSVEDTISSKWSVSDLSLTDKNFPKFIDEIQEMIQKRQFGPISSLQFEVGDYKTEKKIEVVKMLIEAIDHEIKNPDTTESMPGSWVNKSDNLKSACMRTLREFGSEIIPTTRDYRRSSDGEFKDWMTILLAFYRDSTVYNELREELVKRPHPLMRTTAIRALGKYKNPEDFPIFIEALSDTFYVKGNPPIGPRGRYPVSDAAFTNLLKNGYTGSIKSKDKEAVKEDK
ncbi:MAG: HEAT repeat domain-containing protein [candidate division Zixibacteria bacterium]|nr:HEAT repeat domain-containing protein [candidate division Zixibacteria bacterium]